MLEVIKAIVLGCVEGLTEFLPISSTGHLILVGHFLSFTGDKAKTFEIVIQLGSILAVVVLYFKRFLSLFNFKKRSGLNLLHIIIGMIPASVLGFLFHDVIKNVLFSPFTVGIGLFLGAFLMIYAEKRAKPNLPKIWITYRINRLSLSVCINACPYGLVFQEQDRPSQEDSLPGLTIKPLLNIPFC